jgi:prepilin-type processing-associated H-X9-DG protein
MSQSFDKDPTGQAQPKSSGMPVAVIVLLVIGIVGVVGVAGMCVLVGVGGALITPAFSSAREAARRTQCKNNVQKIEMAMHTYADDYGSFPPAFVADENGKPMHSWRVLVLEYIDPALFNQYDMSKPWDSPENHAVMMKKPNIFGCPSSTAGNETNYMVVTGPGTLYPQGDVGPQIQSITDGTSNTILVVEVHNSGVKWTQPVDLPIGQVTIPVNTSQPSSNHPGGINVGFADGSVKFLAEGVDDQNLKQQIHPADRR